MLIDGVNVQMDTGEGKTYVVVLGATALLAEHPQVLIITANEYLARRDLSRVRPYLDAAGIAYQYGVPGPDFRGVSYSTIEDACFAYLHRTYRRPGSRLPDYPLQAAVLIDEIDSVLLDRGLTHTLVRKLPADENLWEEVFNLVDTWNEQQFGHDSLRDRISLTARAYEEVSALGQGLGRPTSLLMDLVTAALWARRAREGRQYSIEDEEIRLINQITGESYTTGSTRARALEHLIFHRDPPVHLQLAGINALTLLKRHPRVVGLSGTAEQESIYFLQQLGLYTGRVPSRFKRHHGRITTSVSLSRKVTHDYLAQRIEEVSPRPVVVGTWSPEEARSVADSLYATGKIDATNLRVVTKFDSDADASVLDTAGDLHRVTILSQGGSRGVDIRSTHRPLLIVLGHAMEPRLDRQFLGRVGRHGEPFDAEFLVDPNSPIWVDTLRPVLRSLDMADEVLPLEKNRVAARGFRRAQRQAWGYLTRARLRATPLTDALGEVEAAVAAQFDRVRGLVDDTQLQIYIDELVPNVTATDSVHPRASGPTPAGVSSDATRTGIRPAIERRRGTDAIVERFEEAVRLTDPGRFADHEDKFRLTRTIPGEPNEVVALTRWLENRLHEVALHADENERRLFRRQAEQAARQRLPVPTTPHHRAPVDVIHETLLMANAMLMGQTDRRVEALRVASPRDVLYRRAVYIVRNLRESSELSTRREIVANLSHVDRPELLDDLYYSCDHQIWESGGEQDQGISRPSPLTTTAGIGLSDKVLGEAVDRFLDELKHRPGGLPLPEAYARLLLSEVARPIIGLTAPISGPALRRHVDLVLASLAANGTKGGVLRDHQRIIRQFMDSLWQQGMLPTRLPRAAPGASTLRRAKSFAATVPRLGVMAVLAYLGVMAVGFLLVAAQARHLNVLDIATELYGFGSLHGDQPILAFFAVLVVIYAVQRASGLVGPMLVLAPFAPLVAVLFAVVFYGRRLSNIGLVLLLILVLLLWSRAFFAVQRYVATFVGIDAGLVVAAASVSVYLGLNLVHSPPQSYAPIAVGVIATVAGPRIPVSIGSTEYARGKFRHIDERARVRVPLDPTLTSGAIALVPVVLVLGVRGGAAIAAFAVGQLLVFGVLTARRLRLENVEALLAKLGVGSTLRSGDLRQRLLRAVLWSILIGGFVLIGGVTLAATSGDPTVPELLLKEWSGVLLADGLLSAGNAMSVAGVGTPLRSSEDDKSGMQLLREKLRSWRQMRFAWLIQTVMLVTVLIRPLQWIADWTGAVNVVKGLWKLIEKLVFS